MGNNRVLLFPLTQSPTDHVTHGETEAGEAICVVAQSWSKAPSSCCPPKAVGLEGWRLPRGGVGGSTLWPSAVDTHVLQRLQ